MHEQICADEPVGWDQRACERRPTVNDVAIGRPALASSLFPPYTQDIQARSGNQAATTDDAPTLAPAEAADFGNNVHDGLAVESEASDRTASADDLLTLRDADEDDHRPSAVERPTAANDEPPPGDVEPIAVASKPGSNHRQRRAASPRHALNADRRPRTIWGEPLALLDQLDSLACECDAGQWASQAADLIRLLCRAEQLHAPRTSLVLKRLRDLVDPAHPLMVLGERTPKRGELRRLRYAVLRRLDFWELVPDLADRDEPQPASGHTVSLSTSRRTASTEQHLAKLLSHLERFEQTGLTDDGRDLAADVVLIQATDEKLTARSRRWLDWNYRNSNLRIVVSKEFINRLVPTQPAVEEPVHDRILGVPTRGWSTSTARLSIRLVPDAQSLRFALEARGVVLARTTSRRDPVTLYSNSDSAYFARKQFELTAAGLKTWPTEAEVSNSSRLRGVETDFDDVPILGFVVEEIARAKHAESEPAVRRVARRKVATRVQEEIDSAIEPKLAEARKLYQQRVVGLVAGLQVEPTVIELQTSEARVTSRLRLAGDEQLAACTPRPMALSDSLASVQIHQSLVNNIGDRLDLDGQTFTLPDLQQRLLKAFQLPPDALPEEYPADLRITFAKRDALTARFDAGRVEFTLGVSELHKFPKTWREFQVRVYYRPQVRGLDVRLVRDGTVQLRGEHFGHEPQIALRGIFSKVFSPDRELVFVEPRLLSDARLAGLSVTQCVLTDGWIGLSFGTGSLREARRTVGAMY
ncbi:MAG TPA: hypothetical protein VNH11_02835 [Pirellulales bacterium]|nr:hypothetical protein [Pirellulales bacterium]